MAKKNNALIVKIGIWLVGLAFAAGGFYLLVNFRLDTVEGDVKIIKGDVKSIKTDDIPKALEPIKSDVKRIKEIDLPNLEGDADYQDDRFYETEKEVYGLKKDIGSLSEKVDRYYLDQQNFQTEQKLVQKEILDGIKELRK